MQSDERVASALTALAPRIGLFRFAVSAALERARSTLASESGPGNARAMLGEFGERLIDPEIFAQIASGAGPLDATAHAAAERCADVLDSLLLTGDEQFVVDVSSGASLPDAVRQRLAMLGSVFAAAAIIEHVRRRTYDPAQHQLPVGYPFELWSAGDRKLAPPLVVRIDGSDLDAVALAPLIDGSVRLVLLVSGCTSPAPLAPLVSPGVFVAQSDDTRVLDRVKDFEGPAFIAVMTGAEARFVHDPRAGASTWQRIEVTRIPTVQPRKSFGVRSAWQQRDDLAHLKSLVEQPVFSAVTGAPLVSVPGNGADPADRLTAWLLDQSGLSVPAGGPA
jgi:hypothetical protein